LWATAIFEGLDIAITPFGDLQFAPGTKRFFINKLFETGNSMDTQIQLTSNLCHGTRSVRLRISTVSQRWLGL
jgi:hypothetical protein